MTSAEFIRAIAGASLIQVGMQAMIAAAIAPGAQFTPLVLGFITSLIGAGLLFSKPGKGD